MLVIPTTLLRTTPRPRRLKLLRRQLRSTTINHPTKGTENTRTVNPTQFSPKTKIHGGQKKSQSLRLPISSGEVGGQFCPPASSLRRAGANAAAGAWSRARGRGQAQAGMRVRGVRA
jgi:hypothetical protein